MVVGLAVALSILYILHTQLIHVNEMKCHSMLNGIPCCAVLYCFTSCSGIVMMGCGMCGINDAFKKGIGGKGDHHYLLKVGQSMVSGYERFLCTNGNFKRITFLINILTKSCTF